MYTGVECKYITIRHTRWEALKYKEKIRGELYLYGMCYAPTSVQYIQDDGMNKNKPTISEKDFSTQVEYLLDLFDWRWCHFRPARTKEGWTTALSGFSGFPDYIAVKESLRKSRVLFFELKSEKGKLTKNQNDWLEALKKTGYCEVYIWRPSDAEKIAEILR